MKKHCHWSNPSIVLLASILLALTACGRLELGIEGSATPDATAAVTPRTPFSGVAGQGPTPTSVLEGSHLSFVDPVLGFSLEIPLWWEAQTQPGAVTHFYQPDHTGTRQAVLTISVLSPDTDSLETALEEVGQGAWGPYVQEAQPVQLGALEGLRLEFTPGADRPPVAWLVVTPSGRAVGMFPGGNLDLIEPMIEVVLDTLCPIEPQASETTLPPAPSLTRTPTPTPASSGSLTDLAEPLLIDGERGWIFASAQLHGQPRTVKLATQDGNLLAAFDAVGRLALDRTGGRLFVDRGEAGVAILDARTGAWQALIALAAPGPASADPQVDPTSGLAFVFRDKTIYVIDPVAAAVTRSVTTSIPSTVCDDPGEDAAITASFYDLVNRKLYLAFVTRVCTPWVTHTIVAYDAATLTELGRYDTGDDYHAVPYSNSLYGTTASRLGRNVSWAWNGREIWFEEGDEGRALQGIVADWGRQMIYEALAGQIWTLKPYPREVLERVNVPLLANGGRLAGHDPISDQLYFLVQGGLEVHPTASILTAPGQQTDTTEPYCRPSEAAVRISASATTLKVGQVLTVTLTLANGVDSGVRLGQVNYSLGAQPTLFSTESLGPLQHRLTIEPGEADEAQFALQAETPGRVSLTGSTSFEIHTLDYSSGSWSGCDSEPLEIDITP